MRALGVIVLFAVVMALVPVATDSGVVLNFVTMALSAALIAQAWNLLGGFGGQFSFGHALFFGTGAYAQAIAQLQGGLNPWLALQDRPGVEPAAVDQRHAAGGDLRVREPAAARDRQHRLRHGPRQRSLQWMASAGADGCGILPQGCVRWADRPGNPVCDAAKQWAGRIPSPVQGGWSRTRCAPRVGQPSSSCSSVSTR